MDDATNSPRHDGGETQDGAAERDTEVYDVTDADAMFDLESFAAAAIADTTEARAEEQPAATHDSTNADNAKPVDAKQVDAKEQPSLGSDAAGPLMIELIATRAELRRVEGELEQRAEDAKGIDAERVEMLDQQARLKADFDNFRRRAERARTETYGQIVGEVVGKLLPIADNLRRALDTAEMGAANRSLELEQFTQGIELIHKQLSDTLKIYGVAAIPTVGATFDPNVHEAIALEDSDEFDSNTVIAEIVRGYTLGGKLLRPAMVKVAK
ncbi:MAG: nucleotide exchange factor GrpE [Pyrinomonadaceae bacterium MAG19_C2-C3]|nr:nucleotide exchange factor GrpE [Pyrinomonadaceae bacterium MAG19_C2-C3]